MITGFISKNDGDVLYEQRYRDNVSVLKNNFHSLYNKNSQYLYNVDELFDELKVKLQVAYDKRSDFLKHMDIERLNNEVWYMSQENIAMSLYVDLFADNFNQIVEKISYFKELGVNYLHFMPVLKTREGDDDGGFAISNFRDTKSNLGTISEFERLVLELKKEGISVCIDFVLNHVAKEHDWAERAAKGDQEYQQFFMMYDTNETPLEFEKYLPEIFPDVSPGNFTYCDEFQKWVFTTFYPYQWDLNYQNPKTLITIIEELFFLINIGIDVFRIDAIRHIWKQIGTDCSALPETFAIMEIIKRAVYIVAPGVIFKGEAVAPYDDVVSYFGSVQTGCQLMYNVSLMTSLWHALASRKSNYLRECINKGSTIPHGSCWNNYIRCHDDITWVFENDLFEKLEMTPAVQEQLLILFYKGDIFESFSRGEFSSYEPKTKNAKISGTLASLCGVDKSLDENDSEKLEIALKRILLLYSIVLSLNGIPLIYSGDEIAVLNNYEYKDDEIKKHDSRWLHRGKFDWEKAKKRNNYTTVEGCIFQSLKKMITVRKNYEVFRSDAEQKAIDVNSESILAVIKKNEKGMMLTLSNFSESHQVVEGKNLIRFTGIGKMKDILTNFEVMIDQENIKLKPYEFMWLHVS